MWDQTANLEPFWQNVQVQYPQHFSRIDSARRLGIYYLTTHFISGSLLIGIPFAIFAALVWFIEPSVLEWAGQEGLSLGWMTKTLSQYVVIGCGVLALFMALVGGLWGLVGAARRRKDLLFEAEQLELNLRVCLKESTFQSTHHENGSQDVIGTEHLNFSPQEHAA